VSVTYSAYELRRTLLRQVRGIAGIQTDLVTRLPVMPDGRGPVLAANALVQALQLTHERPEFGITTVHVAEGEAEVREDIVLATPFARLIRFAKVRETAGLEPKVLVVPGLAGHYATLVRGTVRTLLPDHDVYVADWANARDVPVSDGPFGLDEYIEHLMEFLRAIGPGAHVLSVCQPAVACLAAASIMAEDEDPCGPASLILLAGPVDTRVNPSKVSRFAQRQSVARLKQTVIHTVPSHLEGRGRRVYPGFLQVAGFMAMDVKRHARSLGDLCRAQLRGDAAAADRIRAFYQEYFAVLDMCEEFYLETAQRVFMEHDLPRGEFTWKGRLADPARITSALFTIEGANDELCPPGQTAVAHYLCPGVPAARKKQLVQEGVGHYGVFAGSIFEDQIYPQIRDFISGTEAVQA
jgi:poly(3-hydroxybutyrate) depolymerase